MKTYKVETDFGVEIEVRKNPEMDFTGLEYDPIPWILVCVRRDGRILSDEEIDEDLFCSVEDFVSYEVDELIRNPYKLCEP